MLPEISESETLDIRACPVGDNYPHYIFPLCLAVTSEKGIGEHRYFGFPWTALHMVAISIQETGWGKSIRSSMGNNIAGIHAGDRKLYIELKEGQTGNLQKYRYYRNFKECFYSLHYSIRESTHYMKCRNDYLLALVNCKTEMARRYMRAMFMHEFSKIYSEDPEHGVGVISLYRRLESHFLSEGT